MTDVDEPDGDHPDGVEDEEHASVEEVAAELERLSRTPADWRRIELAAKFWVRGTAIHPRALVHMIVTRLLTPEGKHRRRWHRKETMLACFNRTMKSIIQDYWRGAQNPITAIDDIAAGLHYVPDPERQVIARNELVKILSALDDDKHTRDIALARAQGESRAEIKKRFALTDTAYETALKRIQRAVQKRASGGPQ
jgi:hypothetical protein